MSEHKGPWIRPNGNVVMKFPTDRAPYTEINHRGFPVVGSTWTLPDNAIPLVPQTEVDLEHRRLNEVLAGANRSNERLTAELAETKASLELSDAALAEANAAPSLPAPDANDPAQCLFVSEVSRRLEPEVAEGYADWERGLTAREWGKRADRLEREQAEKAKRGDLAGLLATAILQFENSRYDHSIGEIPSLTPIDYANAVLDRFDITPKGDQ